MKNPLRKRIGRELKHDAGKYIALFLFLFLTIGFISGFLVAGDSMKRTYDEGFEKYNIEDGHFVTYSEAGEGLLSAVEEENDVKVSELFCKDKTFSDDHTVRIYKIRTDVNMYDVLEGELPDAADEIALDRLYCENNSIEVGDTVLIEDTEFTVTGYIALSDYSCLFKNNTDMMFDAQKFTISMVTDEAFESLSDVGIRYCYAWVNNDKTLSVTEQQDKAMDIAESVNNYGSAVDMISALKEGGLSDALGMLTGRNAVTDLIDTPDNQAIQFTGDDIGGDGVMAEWLLYIMMAVIAFVFAVTAKNTIEQEASVVGTLMASGFRKSELLRHYITIPLLVTLTAAVLGNIAGYTLFKTVVANMYLHSYSLFSYTTYFDYQAFLKTTLIPCGIVLVITILVTLRALSFSPLQFLRHEMTRRQKKKNVRLPYGLRFFSRFRMRIIFSNIPAYLTMFAGIFFAGFMLFFGMMFTPLLDNFQETVSGSKIASYQYVLKAEFETSDEKAEKYCVTSLVNDNDEEIMIYGVDENSAYVDVSAIDFSSDANEVYLSDGFMEKYGIETGDEVTLKEKYEDKSYTFRVKGVYTYPASLSVFMSRSAFNSLFGQDEDYYTGYFSDEKLDDIDELYISSIITEHDLNIMAEQLDDSMGRIFPMFGAFGIAVFMLMMYILSKIIIEKNSSSISMIKILGYTDSEAGSLYNRSTAVVLVISLLVSLPIFAVSVKAVYYMMMLEYNGWLSYYIAPWIYPAIFAIGIVCYFVISRLLLRKIKKIKLSEALKTME